MLRITKQNRPSISPIKVDLANLVLVGSLLTMLLLTGCSSAPTKYEYDTTVNTATPAYVWNTNLDKQIPQY